MGDKFRAPKSLDGYDDTDAPDDEGTPRVKPAASYKRNQIQLSELVIPPLLSRVLLRDFYPDADSVKQVKGDGRRRGLLKFARQLKAIGATHDEMMVATWLRSLQRCSPPLTSDAIEELVSQAMMGNTAVDTLEAVSKIFGQWRYSPAELRLYYKSDLEIKLNQNHIWTLDILIEHYEHDIKIVPNDEVVRALNDNIESIIKAEEIKASKGLPSRKVQRKASRDLRDWAFKNDMPSDYLIGKDRLISTGGGEIRLNFNWNPYEDPKVGKIFSSE